MRRHTVEDIEYDLSLLWIHEGEGVSQAALAEREGMSQGHLSRRLARARLYRQRWDEEQRLEERRANEAIGGLEDLPYLPFTSGQGAGGGYNLDTDECALESGSARFGDRNGTDAISGSGCTRQPISLLEGQRLMIRNVNAGPRIGTAGRRDHKPDPRGLKGGVG